MTDNFQIQTIKTLEGIENIRQVWKEMQAKEAYPKINPDIDRYLSIIKTNTAYEEIQPYIIHVNQNNRIVSILIGSIKKTPIKCNIGRKTIFRPTLKTLDIVYGGILGNPTGEICNVLIDELIKALRRGDADVVNFNHVETNTELYKTALKKTNVFCRNYFSKIETHRYMLIPQDFKQFLNACSHNQRRNIRRWTKKFERKFANRFEIKTYCDEDEIDSLLDKMAHISAKTYQRAFGSGIINNEITQVLFRYAAKKGWLRTYILSINDQPCAFWTGLIYNRIFFAEATGYVPEFKDYHIGTMLFIKLVEDLCKDSEVDHIDFSFGEGQHKQWGESRSWSEASIHIFASRLVPILTNLIFSSTTAMSAFVEYATKKFEIFNLVQKYRRNTAMQKANKIKHSIKSCSDVALKRHSYTDNNPV